MNKTSSSLSLISAFKKHYWIAIFTFISTIGASVLYLNIIPSRYKTEAKLIVGEQEVSVSNLGQQLTEKNIKTPGKTADPVATQAELVKTRNVLQRALRNFQQDTGVSDNELPDIRTFKKAINVEIMPATNVLRLTYHDSDPKIAAQLLNSVAKSVVEENIETNRSQASTLRRFLEAKITEQQAKLKQVEATESGYRQAQGQIDLETQTKSLVNSLTELENEERMLMGQLRATTINNDLLKQVTGVDTFEQASQIIRLSEDEELQKLHNRRKELEGVIINRRSYLTDQSPELQTLLAEQDDLQSLYKQKLSDLSASRTLASNVLDNAIFNSHNLDLISKYVSSETENQALENRLSSVRAELKSLRVQAAQIPAYEKVEASLKLLQSKLEEVQIAEARPTSSSRIVDLASVNTIPVFPSRPAAILAISGFAGTLIAITIVLLLEMAERSSYNTVKNKAALSLPVLGVLPELPSTFDKYFSLEQFLDNSALVEPYRALLKTLESSVNASPFNSRTTPVIVVSNIVPGKENSSAVLHLSAVAAMLSRRTLIIDADLRQPMQHQLLDVPSSPGLTEVLENPNAFSSVVQPTPIKNLSVLTHGQFSSRPAALIESESMITLLAKVVNHYDLVIVDASPVSVCADATTLGQLTNNLVLVVREDSVFQETIVDTISKVQHSGVPILGVVMDKSTNKQNKNFYLNGKSEQNNIRYLSEKKNDFATVFKKTISNFSNFT
ncbi:MAG: GumC family protein [Waterburya sp.]